MVELRRAQPDDAHEIAPLILHAAPYLRLLLGDDHDAWHAAEHAFRSDRTMFGYRYGMVATEDGRIAGFLIAFPGRLWGSLKLGTGVTLARAAGVKHAGDLVKRGRILDRLHPGVPPEVLYVSALAVHPDFRRRGVARALLERAVAGAQGLHLGVALDVDLGNDAARLLYESLGFREISYRETGETERGLVETPGFARMVRPPGV
jgi:ribosomal protein S18 acetylase RimI-like enzyme